MKLKAGVSLTDLSPQMVLALLIVDGIYNRFGVECVVTSVNDGKHSTASLHYKGRAADTRTKYPELDGREEELRDEVAASLGFAFDVLLEAVGTDNEHLHIEWDPMP